MASGKITKIETNIDGRRAIRITVLAKDGQASRRFVCMGIHDGKRVVYIDMNCPGNSFANEQIAYAEVLRSFGFNKV